MEKRKGEGDGRLETGVDGEHVELDYVMFIGYYYSNRDI